MSQKWPASPLGATVNTVCVYGDKMEYMLSLLFTQDNEITVLKKQQYGHTRKDHFMLMRFCLKALCHKGYHAVQLLLNVFSMHYNPLGHHGKKLWVQLFVGVMNDW